MSGDVINLREARKRRARIEAERKAVENRARFGRTKAEKRHEDANKILEMSRLDAKIRERPPTHEDD